MNKCKGGEFKRLWGHKWCGQHHAVRKLQQGQEVVESCPIQLLCKTLDGDKHQTAQEGIEPELQWRSSDQCTFNFVNGLVKVYISIHLRIIGKPNVMFSVLLCKKNKLNHVLFFFHFRTAHYFVLIRHVINQFKGYEYF